MGVASGCGEQEVGVASGSGWNLWVCLLGVVVRRYIDFLILLIPTSLVSVLFAAASPTFCSFKKNFFVLVPVLFVRATTGVPRQPYEGCTYSFIHEEAHTNVHFISCDGHQLYAFNGLGVDLEVEGVHYIEMHRGPATHVLGPPPSRDIDLELEGGVNVSL